MSIFGRVFGLSVVLVLLAALSACGGNGDDGDGGGASGDSSGEAFELPRPGEYSFDVTATIDIEFSEPGLSAAPFALGGLQGVPVEGGLRIQLAEDGSFTINDRHGIDLIAGEETEAGAAGGSLPITFTQNEDMPSMGSISRSGMMFAELFLEATLPDADGTVTTTNEEPIRLEGEGDPFSDEGATLTTPSEAEPARFMAVEGYGELSAAIFDMFIHEAITGQPQGTDEGPTVPATADLEFGDDVGDGQECDSGDSVDDPAVDIQSVTVTTTDTRVEVEVGLGQSPQEGAKDLSFSVQARIGQEGGYQVGQYEFDLGQPNSGLQETPSKVEADTARYVSARNGSVLIVFPDTSIEKGDTATARTFHLKAQGDKRNCDVTEAFPLDELVPCGGRCTPEP